MKQPVYSLVLACGAALLLSACAQDPSPGPLNRDDVLLLRGDGWAVQRYENCPEGVHADGMKKWHHHRRHHHTMIRKTDAAAPVATSKVKKEEAKKEIKKDEKKDAPKDKGAW